MHQNSNVSTVHVLMASYSEMIPNLTSFLLDHIVLLHTNLRSKLSFHFAVLRGVGLNPGQAGTRKLEGIQRNP